MRTFRRTHVDKLLSGTKFAGDVLDVGGKKEKKRGQFRPPTENIDNWTYLNIDLETNPDIVGDAAELPIENESYDMALAAEVLEHLPKPELSIQEVCRILRPGGRFIATIPFLYSVHADPYDFQRWTPTKLSECLTDAGFSEVNITPMGGVWAVIGDLLNSAFKSAAVSPTGLGNRLARLLLVKPARFICNILEQIWIPHKVDFITTGYYIEATKPSTETSGSSGR